MQGIKNAPGLFGTQIVKKNETEIEKGITF